jgi:hypothetical protein
LKGETRLERNRLDDLLYESKQYLFDGETVIYIKDEEMIVQWNDGEDLIQVSGNKHKSINQFLEWLYDESRY